MPEGSRILSPALLYSPECVGGENSVKFICTTGRCQPLTRHAWQEHADLLVGQAVLLGVTLQTRSRPSPETSPPKLGSLSLHPPLLKIPIPVATRRCEPSEGTFCTVTCCPPGSRATRVEEPPPSRLRASSAPSFRIISANSFVLRPTLFAERPSTVTR